MERAPCGPNLAEEAALPLGGEGKGRGGALGLAVRGQRAGLLTGREAAVVDGGDEANAVAVGAAGRRAQHLPGLRRVLVIGVALP